MKTFHFLQVIGCKLCGERKRIPTARRDYQIKAERDGKIGGGSSSSNTTPPNGANSDSNDKRPTQLENVAATATTSCEATNVESDPPEPESSSINIDASMETLVSTPVVVSMETEVVKVKEYELM